VNQLINGYDVNPELLPLRELLQIAGQSTDPLVLQLCKFCDIIAADFPDFTLDDPWAPYAILEEEINSLTCSLGDRDEDVTRLEGKLEFAEAKIESLKFESEEKYSSYREEVAAERIVILQAQLVKLHDEKIELDRRNRILHNEVCEVRMMLRTTNDLYHELQEKYNTFNVLATYGVK